ncbi:YifB family Mg chelatase-like AAA ATPase [Bartonella sp. DGB1]|uniref:YifB family Mg chelatase-like AAA ATPase n=1 Tax=Bartonella sp. DGB1 TaxID=3239807 RepID=UPI0035233FB6
MMSYIKTFAFRGVEAIPIEVQTLIANGKMGISVVGLPDKVVAESKERITAAFFSIGIKLPAKKIIVNLSPADLPKEGSHYDLPIALGILRAMEKLANFPLDKYYILGELALDASIKKINGALLAASKANAEKCGLICPELCKNELTWLNAPMDIIAAPNLLLLIEHLSGNQKLPELILRKDEKININNAGLDIADVKGQRQAKRALEIAAAGSHNLLFIGPPGAGKSMLASRLPSILPPLTRKELLETLVISSLAGSVDLDNIYSGQRPFRAPHHSASMAAMVGGGLKIRPGEVSLAHNGVLFLDELPEFAPKVLDSLRQLLETGEVSIARANYHLSYPARIQLIAAMNPCRCGRAGEEGYHCVRGEKCRLEYQSRLSAPLLDRIDLKVELPSVTIKELLIKEECETSVEIAARVQQARNIQQQRYKKLALPINCNAYCPSKYLEQILNLTPDGNKMINLLSNKLKISARSFHRIMRVARTIADLSAEEKCDAKHIAESAGYRMEMLNVSE